MCLKIQILLWQMFQNVVLTRQIMKNINWPGNPHCSFCSNIETPQRLFFICLVARIVWRFVGVVLRTDLFLNNHWQFYSWCSSFTPHGERFYTMDLVAIIYAIWNSCNRTMFEKKLNGTPFEIVFSACTCLFYQAILQKEDVAAELRAGAGSLCNNNVNLMKISNASHDMVMSKKTRTRSKQWM